MSRLRRNSAPSETESQNTDMTSLDNDDQIDSSSNLDETESTHTVMPLVNEGNQSYTTELSSERDHLDDVNNLHADQHITLTEGLTFETDSSTVSTIRPPVIPSRVTSPLSLLIDDPRMDHLITIDVPIPQVQTISRDQMSPEERTTEEMVAQTNKLT